MKTYHDGRADGDVTCPLCDQDLGKHRIVLCRKKETKQAGKTRCEKISVYFYFSMVYFLKQIIPPIPYLGFERHGGFVGLDVAKRVPWADLVALLQEKEGGGREGGRDQWGGVATNATERREEIKWTEKKDTIYRSSGYLLVP